MTAIKLIHSHDFNQIRNRERELIVLCQQNVSTTSKHCFSFPLLLLLPGVPGQKVTPVRKAEGKKRHWEANSGQNIDFFRGEFVIFDPQLESVCGVV